jgi:hypothetical protein
MIRHVKIGLVIAAALALGAVGAERYASLCVGCHLVAFVRRMPEMTPQTYRELSQGQQSRSE